MLARIWRTRIVRSGSPSVQAVEVRGGFVRDELASDLARETPP